MTTFQKTIQQLLKQTKAQGFTVRPAAADYLLSECRKARALGKIRDPGECKIAAAGLLAAAMEATKDKQIVVIDVAEILQGWRKISASYCNPPHKCLLDSILKRSDYLKETLPKFNELLVEDLVVELSESGDD